MKSVQVSTGAVTLATGFVLVSSMLGACGDDRAVFSPPQAGFDIDAGAADAETCSFQCSLDGRSVIQSCTGEVVERCADNLACGEARCQEPCAAAAADRSSNGCEFYVSMPRFMNAFAPQSCHATFVVNTSNQPASVSLEFRGKSLDVSKALFRVVPNSTKLEVLQGPIPPGESAILFVSDRDPLKARNIIEMQYYIGCPKGVTPAILEDFGTFASTIGPAFHLTSNVPIGLTSMYPYGGADSYIPTATLVLPVSAWGTEHVVVDGWEASHGDPTTQIFASEDETEVTIVGTKDIVDGSGFKGAVAKTPMTIHLSKGEFAQIVQTEELTGSFVFSNKPTVTVGGNGCAFLPSHADLGACDTLAQEIAPFEQWGSEYVGVGYRPRTADQDEVIWYRMVAGRDGTELDYDPVKPAGAPLNLSAGQMAVFEARSNEAFVVRSRDSEHPFYLGINMPGSASGLGDPDFVNVVPTGQFLSSYSFYADSTYAENSLVVVRQKSKSGRFDDVWIECAGNLPNFVPIDSGGQYEYARVDLSRDFGRGDTFGDKACTTGLQRMRSDGAFSATIWGWGPYASYGYPGGMAIRKLVKTPLAPVK